MFVINELIIENMHARIHAYIYARFHTRVYTYIQVNTFIHAHSTSTCMCIYMRTQTCIHVHYIFTNTYIHTYTHNIDTYIRMCSVCTSSVYIHICTHTWTMYIHEYMHTHPNINYISIMRAYVQQWSDAGLPGNNACFVGLLLKFFSLNTRLYLFDRDGFLEYPWVS